MDALARHTAAWSVTAAICAAMVARCRAASPEERLRIGPAMARTWARTVARIFDVTIRLTPRAEATLAARQPRVITFNHASTFDLMGVSAWMPEGSVIVAKKELRRTPLLGQATAVMGTLYLDRGDHDRAYASLEAAAQRIQQEALQVLIAPEGRRSDDGSLQRFKLGAFHLSHIAQVPIQPMVLHGTERLWLKGTLAPIPGTMVVDALPETSAAALAGEPAETPEALRSAADTLRERYIAALAAGPDLRDP